MSEKPGGREVRQEIYIEASPETVFALLTDATEIKKWQAEIVDADPVPDGVFRLAESGGMQIEGHYVEVVPYFRRWQRCMRSVRHGDQDTCRDRICLRMV